MHLRIKYALLMTSCLFAPIVGHGQPRTATSRIEITLLTDLIGYIEPCGCTVDVMLGGLDRLVGQCIQPSTHAETPLRLVIGHTFFDPNSSRSLKAQDKLKASLIGDALNQIGFRYSIRPNTPEYVTDEIRKLERDAGLHGISTPTQIDHGGMRIGLLLISSPKDLEKLRRSKPKALDGANLMIAVSFLSRLETRRLLREINWVDITVLAHGAREQKHVESVLNGYFVEAGDRGRHLARLTIEGPNSFEGLHYVPPVVHMAPNPLFSRPITETMPTQGTRQASLKFDLIALDESVRADQTMTRRIQSYTTSLRKLYSTKVRKDSPVDDVQSPYAGIQVCADCHPEAVEFWNKTAHAKAWATLESRGKTFDAECVACHVTGWDTAGGATIGHTAKLENVQCEVCHGPSKAHAEAGGDKTLLTAQHQPSHCATCHNEHHSPRFSYPTYRVRVLGPGHGSPPDSTP
ncbi:MAG: multiheme c-type cytochrome [Bradymonadia bacterium]